MIKTWSPLSRTDLNKLVSFKQEGEISYRVAHRRDIKQLLDVERDVYEEIPWTYSHFHREIVGNRQAAFIVAVREEKIVAYIGMRWEKKLEEFHISNFIVRKDYQSQGLGSVLLSYAEKVAYALRIYKILLKVDRTNYPAQAFYRRRGFDSLRIIEKYYDSGNDALEMGKELSFENR